MVTHHSLPSRRQTRVSTSPPLRKAACCTGLSIPATSFKSCVGGRGEARGAEGEWGEAPALGACLAKPGDVQAPSGAHLKPPPPPADPTPQGSGVRVHTRIKED